MAGLFYTLMKGLELLRQILRAEGRLSVGIINQLTIFCPEVLHGSSDILFCDA